MLAGEGSGGLIGDEMLIGEGGGGLVGGGGLFGGDGGGLRAGTFGYVSNVTGFPSTPF